MWIPQTLPSPITWVSPMQAPPGPGACPPRPSVCHQHDNNYNSNNYNSNNYFRLLCLMLSRNSCSCSLKASLSDSNVRAIWRLRTAEASSPRFRSSTTFW